MSQHRLDQTCRLPVGTRDACHVPYVVAQAEHVPVEQRLMSKLEPRSYVKFVDKDYTRFVLCDKEEAHGVLNPMIDEICYYDPVVVLMLPGITTPVQHGFEIRPEMRDMERKLLDNELEECKKEDGECASC